MQFCRNKSGRYLWQVAVRLWVHNILLRAAILAFHWRNPFESGRFATVSERAATEDLNGSYPPYVLRLTLLAQIWWRQFWMASSLLRMQLPPLSGGSLRNGMANTHTMNGGC